MAPLNFFEDDSSDAESARDSGSESSSSSGRSGSVSSHHGVAPTPGRGFGSDGEQEPSSPQSNKGRQSRSPDNSSLSHRSRSGTPASGSPHSQRSKGAVSVRSRSSSSGRSRSAGSNQSRRSSRRSSYSGSPAHSDRSQSPQKREIASKIKSPVQSPIHHRSSSPVSSKSGKSHSTRDSRSRSPKSPGSHSSASSRSASPASPSNKDESSPIKPSNRGGSASPPGSATPRSRAESGDSRQGSDRSRAGSVESQAGSEKSHAGSERSHAASEREGSERSPPPSETSRDGSIKSPAGSEKSRGGSGKNRAASASPASHRSRGSGSPNSSIASPVHKDDAVNNDASDNETDKKAEERKQIPSVSGDDDSAPGSPKSDAESDKPKKRMAVVSSDEEDSGGENKNATAEALFGDADDISSEEEGNKRAQASEDEGDEEKEKESDERGESDDEERRVKDKEEEKEEEVAPETRIDVEIPKIICDIGRDLHFVKLPNFLSVDTRPFSADTYEDEIDEEETLDEEGRARLKLKVENTIRWREVLDREGNTVKESNARFVRWSDGSMSLHLGAEIFDVYKQPLQGDHNHLFIRQGTGLQGQAVFRTKLTFRPHSTESFTHRKMTLSLADRSQKSSGIKVLSQVGHDPDQHRGEMIKKEEEKLRASLRRESKAKRVRERGTGRSLNTSYLEPDREDGSDDDGAISLNAIKDKYNTKSKNENRRNIYSSDDEGSDLDTRRSRRVDKSRALKDSDEEEEVSHDEGSQASGRASPASDES